MYLLLIYFQILDAKYHNYLGWWYNSQDLRYVKQYPLWINLNRFFAYLTKVNVCDLAYMSTHLLNSLLEDHKLSKNLPSMYLDLSNIAQKIRKSPDLFAITLSAATQYMIYAAFNLYTFCKTNLMIGTNIEYCWKD